jgi:hypothetical protein
MLCATARRVELRALPRERSRASCDIASRLAVGGDRRLTNPSRKWANLTNNARGLAAVSRSDHAGRERAML